MSSKVRTANDQTETPALHWKLACTESAGDEPANWIPATVPGAVQLDWAAAHGWPPHTWAEEPARYQGLEDRWWHYHTELPELSAARGCSWWIRFEDVDHRARFFLDGREMTRGGGVGQAIEFPLPDGPPGRTLRVLLEPAPKEPGASGRSRARRTTKAAVAYGWDFQPDLIPLGLAGQVQLESRPVAHLSKVRWQARVSPALDRATWFLEATASGPGQLKAELFDTEGHCVWCQEKEVGAGPAIVSGELANPRLWWPRGHGGQSLYSLRLELSSAEHVHKLEKSVGFRSVRLVMAPGQWEEPSRFPKSRSAPPMSLEVNGRRIFAKGANLVGLDIFRGRVPVGRWRRMVELAAEANMNMLRLWGGEAAPSEEFFEACDELGIMVVQEFPLACNDYPDDPAYLRELETVALALIERLTFHPCLALWSGGNELFNVWSGMTDQSHALRLLAALCWQRDPATPFVPTLPVEGAGHGHYLFRDPKTGEECFAIYQKSRCTAYTEFGVPCPAPETVLRAIIPEDELWPPRSDGSWKMHSGSGAWDAEPTSHLGLATIEHYWGPQPNLSTLLEHGAWLGCEGLRQLVEETRRQRPFNSWCLIWCLNEPWPTAANLSLLSHPDMPKPTYHAVASSMRATLATARVGKFQWQPGEMFEADLTLLHDATTPRPALTIEARLRSGTWGKSVLTWVCDPGPADEDLPGPTIRLRLPECLGDDLLLELHASDSEASNAYRFAVKHTAQTHDDTAPRGLNV